MSKKFTSGLLTQNVPQKESFEMTWPLFSPKADGFSSSPDLKTLETRILKEAREKALQIEKEAYEKGFEQGEKDGREMGLKRLEVVINQVKRVLTEIERQKNGFYQAYEGEMLRLMLGIGKRIFRKAVMVDEEVIISVLREAFQYVTDRGEVIVRLNPADYQYLSAHPDQTPFSFDEKAGIRIIQDPSITRGGCLIDTSFGEVDATFEGQFDEMVSLLLQQRKKAEQYSDQ